MPKNNAERDTNLAALVLANDAYVNTSRVPCETAEDRVMAMVSQINLGKDDLAADIILACRRQVGL